MIRFGSINGRWVSIPRSFNALGSASCEGQKHHSWAVFQGEVKIIEFIGKGIVPKGVPEDV